MNQVTTKPRAVHGTSQATAGTLKLTLVYAAFACLWILLSDSTVGWLLSDPADIVVASTLKGWLFVAVTSVLLYGLVRRLVGQTLASSLRENKALTEHVRSQQLLATIADSSPDVIFAKDKEGRYLLFNQEAARISGKAAELVLGRDDTAIFLPDQAEVVRANDRRVILENRIITYEEILSTVNGERIYLATKGPLRDEAGQVTGLFGISRDITERESADAKIRRLSNLYAALSQCNKLVMHCSNDQELFEQLCRAVVNVGGMKLAWIGVLDQKSKLIVPVASHGDVAGFVSGIEVSADPLKSTGRGPAGTAVRENRASWSQDFLNDPSTAAWHERAREAGWRAVAAVPLRRNGITIGALSIYSPEVGAFDDAVRDLLGEMAANINFALDNFTREGARRQAEKLLKESEGRLSAIFHASPIGISVTRIADGMILDANDAALRLFGYTRDAVIGRTAIELGVYADPAQGKALVAQLRERGQAESFEIDFRAATGKIGKMELTGRVIDLQGDNYLVAMMLDVTERKRLEEAHLQAQKLESLGTLAGGIAHDFNNILAAIRGNADLAARDVGQDHAAAESVEQIRKAGARATELVRRIMTFGRPTEAQEEVVDLGAVVREALKLLRPALPAGISLNADFAGDAPKVLADAGQIHEAIVNLTTNAAYAIGRHTGSIEYRLDPLQVGEKLAQDIPGLEQGPYVRLTVTDSGCGIDAAELDRVFDAFYTTKPAGEGTGLGLSMVHGIMRRHGGAVTVESAPGKGSRFALYFRVATQEAIREMALRPEQSALALGRSGDGQRVLYVDDEEALVFLAKRVLAQMGHQVSGFTDPRQALEIFCAHPQDFDVVVTDLSMPHMSGFEFAREVLALRPEMPVLMTTGYLGDENEASARAAGIREIILKPGTMDELGQVLDRMFGAVSRP